MHLLTITPLRQYVKPMVTIGLLLVAAYISVCLLLVWRQARFIFFPQATLEKTPETLDLPYETVWIPVTASKHKPEHLHGWWIPAHQPNGKVLLYLHGNASNIGANVEHASRFHHLGFSVLLFDYRGYGQSEGGFPSEQQVYADAEAAWHYLVHQRGISPEQIVIYGHSLGGAIAIELATRYPQASGLIVESSFTSIQAMAAYQPLFRFLPIGLLLHQRFTSIAKVSSLNMPVLFIHGTADRDVPFTMSEQLFAAAPEPKRLWLVPNGEHNNNAKTAGEAYFQIIREFLHQLTSPDTAEVVCPQPSTPSSAKTI